MAFFKNGDYYGDFEDDLKHDKGHEQHRLKFSIDTFDGIWVHGMLTGNGTWERMKKSEGSKPFNAKQKPDFYFGQFKGYLKHGYGLLDGADNITYRGLFENNKKNGKGEQTYLNTRQKIEGFWDKDAFSKGNLYQIDERNSKTGRLLGQFSGELRGSFAVFVSSDGTRYEFDLK